MSNFDRILIAGKEQDVKVIGTDQEYQPVRKIVISNGRFLDQADVELRNKVALLTDKLAERMYGSRAAALNQVIRLYGLQFTVIGTFHEKVETFGQSEVERDTILVPDHRPPLLHAGRAHRPSVRPGALAAGGGPGRHPGPGDRLRAATVPAPATGSKP